MLNSAGIVCFFISFFNLCQLTSTTRILPLGGSQKDYGLLRQAATPVREILEGAFIQDYSVLIISDGSVSKQNIQKDVSSSDIPRGVWFYEFEPDYDLFNYTDIVVSQLQTIAVKVRQSWRAILVLVVSEDSDFLKFFAKWSLRIRLLASEMKLLAITRLHRSDADIILRSHWTFSMMDAMILSLEPSDSETRYSCSIYTHLPYSSRGRGLVVKLASWKRGHKLRLETSYQLFPPKFDNFYGSAVNVTSLNFPPFWIEKKSGKNDSEIEYSGADFKLLSAIASSLNFTIYVLPVTTWDEVTGKVQRRESFIAPIIHVLLPKRLEEFDYSYVYEITYLDFSFSMPEIKPKWESLIYPLSHEVWIATVCFFLPVPVVLFLVGRLLGSSPDVEFITALQAMLGILLGQSLSVGLPRGLSGRVLIGSWIIFAFILTASYRGNLIAYLTLPKYPPKPETLEELVEVADRITMPPYGKAFKDFFSTSDSEVFRALGKLMDFVPTLSQGQMEAVEKRQGHMDPRRYQEYNIALEFTRADGTSPLYMGNEVILNGLVGWPLPHDAPFTRAINSRQRAVVEAGLYDYWNREILRQTKEETRQRNRKLQRIKEQQDSSIGGGGGIDRSSSIRVLSLTHFQAPFVLLILGLALGFLSLVFEYQLNNWSQNK